MFRYEYQCPLHGEFEAFSRMANRNEEKPCPECGTASKRVFTAVRFKLEGVSGHYPTAYDKWAKTHEQEAKRADKREEYFTV